MKILVWNIKFFSLNRIKGRSFLNDPLATADDADRALSSLNYICTTVALADADIFVVIEPRASAGEPGTLVNPGSGGPSALITLLAYLQQLAPGWFLVPPQRINSTRQDPIDKGSQYTECIGVFWRNDRLTFTGPWANTVAGIRPPTAFQATAYADPWNKVIPPNTTAAGHCLFFSGQGAAVGFPNPTSRKPFCTTFKELGGMQRTLELYSLHNEKSALESALAADALLKLPFTAGIKKITLLAGDFNINLSASTGLQATSLSALAVPFGALWPPQTGTVLGKGPVYQPTMVMQSSEAAPANYNNDLALDFAFLHYTQDAIPAFTPSCAVVDRVKGHPNPPFTADMLNQLGTYPAMFNAGIDVFRQRWNFAHIGTPKKLDDALAPIADGTSDHLPILLTV